MRKTDSRAASRVQVKGSFHPDVLTAAAGEPIRIVFRREELAMGSERVVFPAFGRSAMLPAFRDVLVELPPAVAGEYEFTCELGLLRGRLRVLSPTRPERRST